MIDKLYIKDFKSIEQYQFDLKALNLLVGPNSSGKSSVIQALLLASDNARGDGNAHKMVCKHLNTPSFKEVRNFVTNAKSYSVGINGVEMTFTPADDFLTGTMVGQSEGFDGVALAYLTGKVLYLPASRTSELSETRINQDPESNALGLFGEYVIDYYQNHRDEVLPDVVIKDRSIRTLSGQLNYWLRKLTGYGIQVQLDGAEYKVRYIGVGGKEIHPHHVGTGVSFITGVLIAGLASCLDGGLLMVENPEIHLHPSAQADILDFLAMIALAGPQVMVETHSDHLFNGVRRLLRGGVVADGDVRVFNFRRADNGTSVISNVTLNQYGGIDNDEAGLFDQFDKDLEAIIG